MRTSSLALLALTLAGPATLSAGSLYTGCGGRLGTCASVSVQATQTPAGTWKVILIVQNTGYRHAKSPAAQAAGINSVNFEGLTGSVHLDRVTTASGQDITSQFTPCGGCGFAGSHGAWGYRETSDPFTGDVLTITHTAIGDPRCGNDPACRALRPADTAVRPVITYNYAPIEIFEFTLSNWNPSVGLSVSAEAYGTGGVELYRLQPNTTVTPEPGTMLLLGSGIAGVVGARRRRGVSRVS